MIGHSVGYQVAKGLSKNAVKKYKVGNMLKQITAAYPEMTGAQLSGATSAPNVPASVGAALKNAMLGVAY